MKKLISLLTMIVILLSMTGCLSGGKPDTDYEAIGQCAVDYMKEKYDVTFDLIDYIVPMKKDYAEIRGYVDGNEEVEYIVYACADEVDENNDGYADSYTIIGDNYMCTILEPLIKNDMDRLLADKGVGNLDCVTSVYNIWERTSDHKRTGGVSNSFPVCNEQNFVLENIVKSYDISYYYDLSISENEYYDGLEEEIANKLVEVFSKENVYLIFNVYSEEDFYEIKEYYSMGEQYIKKCFSLKHFMIELSK